MEIELKKVKPTYMSADELSGSEIYLCPSVVFEPCKKYLISASSGHGKTSILNFIYGSNINFEGQILYGGKDKSKEIFSLRQNSVSYVFQDLKLFPDLTLKENILLKNNITNHKSIKEIDSWVNKVQLGHRIDSSVRTLSLGQRQRTAVLRALCQPFDFLLMDEPFSHLDEENSRILCDIISEELEKNKASLILTSLGGKSYFNYDRILNL